MWIQFPSLPRTILLSYELPWWKDSKYIIGKVSKKPRVVRIKNVLTGLEAPLEVPNEESIKQIVERYLARNSHANSYTWKALCANSEGTFTNLNMDMTLTENGVTDESDLFVSLGLPKDYYIPVIHLYYKDDHTDA
eukprot:c15437_g1_i1 orf=297-704(+)